jgi:hypothetical protein
MILMKTMKDEAMRLPLDDTRAKLGRIKETLRPPDVASDAYSVARKLRRTRQADLDEAHATLQTVARRYNNTIKPEAEELREARARVESTERAATAAITKCAQLKEQRQREFAASVRRQLAAAAPLLSEFAESLSEIAIALDALHAASWRNGLEVPQILGHAPAIRDGCIGLQAIVNAVSAADR